MVQWFLRSSEHGGSVTKHMRIHAGQEAWWREQHGPAEKVDHHDVSLSSFNRFQISCKSPSSNTGLSFQV